MKLPLLVAILCIFTVAAARGDDGGLKSPDRGPIRIKSDSMEADSGRGIVTFKGNVNARQDDVTIMSQSLKVSYGGDSEIDTIEALEDVRIDRQGRAATAEKAVYYPGRKEIVMEGDPRVWRDGNLVQGERITLFLDSDRMDVEGAKAFIDEEKGLPEAEAAPEGSDNR